MKNSIRSSPKRGRKPNSTLTESNYWRDLARDRAHVAEAKKYRKEQEMLRTTSLKDIIH